MMTKTHAIVAFALLVFLLSSFATGYTLYTRFTETNARRADNARVWHAVICSIEKQVVIEKRLSKPRETRALRFYDRLLREDVHTSPCGLLNRR